MDAARNGRPVVGFLEMVWSGSGQKEEKRGRRRGPIRVVVERITEQEIGMDDDDGVRGARWIHHSSMPLNARN